MGVKIRDKSGQMTVEFAIAFPVTLIIALISMNVIICLSECASFDRIAREAIRIHATSPAYGQSLEQSCARIEEEIQMRFKRDNLNSSVSVEGNSLGYTTYTAELHYTPTLFGRGLRTSFFGVELAPLTHRLSLTVDTYKPGVLF